MDNKSALRGLCNALCNTFYPDTSTIEVVLFNEGVQASDDAKPKDAQLLKLAIRLVLGYCESSRTENGVSTSVDRDAVKRNITTWCDDYGLDADDYVPGLKVVEDGTNLW